MKNEKLRIINYPLSIFHYSLPLAIIDFPLIAGLTRNLLRITRLRFRLGGRNERSSESRVKLACTMPRFPNCVRLPVAFRDDIAESNEG